MYLHGDISSTNYDKSNKGPHFYIFIWFSILGGRVGGGVGRGKGEGGRKKERTARDSLYFVVISYLALKHIELKTLTPGLEILLSL